MNESVPSDIFSTDEYFMKKALEQAKLAEEADEVPIGAVIVSNGKIIANGYNQVISTSDPTAHAEIVAIRHASKTLNNYRIIDTTLYVTLEPCYMCVGAITHARIKRVVYGAPDAKTGSVSTSITLLNHPIMNHKVEVVGNILQNECSKIISDFFKKKREIKKEKNRIQKCIAN